MLILSSTFLNVWNIFLIDALMSLSDSFIISGVCCIPLNKVGYFSDTQVSYLVSVECFQEFLLNFVRECLEQSLVRGDLVPILRQHSLKVSTQYIINNEAFPPWLVGT